MGQPSHHKPPPRNPVLQVSSNWRGKSRLRNPNPNPNPSPNPDLIPNPNLNPSRRLPNNPLRSGSWPCEQVIPGPSSSSSSLYQPPRLKDLQFQNKLKATRFFTNNSKRFNSRRNVAEGSSSAPSFHGAVGFPNSEVISASVHNNTYSDSVRIRPDAYPHSKGVSKNYSSKGVSNYVPKAIGVGSELLSPSELMARGNINNSKGNVSHFTGNSSSAFMVPGSNFISPAGMVITPSTNFATNVNTDIVSVRSLNDASTSSKGKAKGKGNGKGNRKGNGNVNGNGKSQYNKRRRPFRRSAPLRVSQAPAAPRNTTSFLMRARKSGGITSCVSPSPGMTPAIYVQTPVMSPFPQFTGLVDEANQEWGVNGYGSMNGLIRLRSSEMNGREDCADNDDTESEVEQDAQSVQKLEERLDHDVSRFVMTYPNDTDIQNLGQNLLETRMDDQDSHIAHLEEENLDLKERLHVMQQEVEDLRRRMQVLEGVGDEEEADSTGRMTADLSCL